MDSQAIRFISELFPYRDLPEDLRRKIAGSMAEEKHAKGEILFSQNRSKIDRVMIVYSGSLELYYEQQGEMKLHVFLQRGAGFGEISLLMNKGVAMRTAKAAEDMTVLTIPKDVFLEICEKEEKFSAHFREAFNQRMRDETYASVVAAGQSWRFLSELEPFSFLPMEELDRIASELTLVYMTKDTLLSIQGRSKIEYLYIIQKGSVERYFEDREQKAMYTLLGEGEIIGGISMLVNDSVPVRTLKIREDSYLYRLPRATFLDICSRHEVFSDFFTDTFGKRMLDRSYATILAKSRRLDTGDAQFFDQPIGNICSRDLVDCSHDTSIQEAARIMTLRNCSSILIKDGNGKYIGLVTDYDLRGKVVSEGYRVDRPVANIMSPTLTSISEDALVLEAMLLMTRRGIKHLAIKDHQDRVFGVLTNRDIMTAQGDSPVFLIQQIDEAKTVEEIADRQKQLPYSVQGLIQAGAKAKNVTRLITTVSDVIYEKLIKMAIAELGKPPTRYAFMILGSDGRKEQTLKTDQDNAIIFEDVPDDSLEEVRDYFLALGDRVCTWLDQAGYEFCKGDVMAKNPQWCQPYSVWEEYFRHWINSGSSEALLKASIFFDFRLGFGDEKLVNGLRESLLDSLVGWAGFFRNLTENALYFKPPLGFFRNFVVESKGQHRNSFDIKGAMTPIVDMARIYSLKNKIVETNTQDRLYQVFLKDALSWKDYNELNQAYSFLMQTRLVRQVSAVIDEGGEPHNYINPKKLSRIEQTMLKEIFRRIENYQSSLSLSFMGI